MDVNQMYNIWLYAINKNKQQGYGSPDDFYVTINQAQRSYLDVILGEYQQYQVQRPISVVEFGQNERLRTTISPLIYGVTLTPNTTTGVAPFPSDFEYPDAMWDAYNLYNIRFVQQDRQMEYVRSTIDPIRQNPVYLINHDGFLFFPADVGPARLSYVRNPPSIVWGYVLDSNGIPVWNPATSQNPVWGETDCMQIIVRALMLVGVNLNLNTVMQYSQNIKEGGQ